MRTFVSAWLLAISVARADTWVSGYINVTQPQFSNLRTPCNNPNGTCGAFFELTPRLPNGNLSQILIASTQGEAQQGVLKSYATASTFGTPYFPPQFPPNFTATQGGMIDVVGAASFSDQWTVTGGTPGTQGSMQLLFNMTGVFATSGPGLLAAYLQFLGFDGRYHGTHEVMCNCPPILSLNGAYQSGPMLVTLPIIFGTPKTFTVQMQSHVTLRPDNSPFGPSVPYPINASATADAMHTGVLSSVVVRNNAGNVIPYQLTTLSGSPAYDNLGQSPLVTATPEPATFGIAAAALSGMFLLRRRRA